MYGRSNDYYPNVLITVPRGEVKWLREPELSSATGPCTHKCRHEDTFAVAWGSSMWMYELRECRSCACRAWHSIDPYTGHRKGRDWQTRQPLPQVA